MARSPLIPHAAQALGFTQNVPGATKSPLLVWFTRAATPNPCSCKRTASAKHEAAHIDHGQRVFGKYATEVMLLDKTIRGYLGPREFAKLATLETSTNQ